MTKEDCIFGGITKAEIVHRHVIDDENFKFIFTISAEEGKEIRIGLEAYHVSEIERASKATIQSEKEPKPCMFINGITMTELSSFRRFAGCLDKLEAYIAGDTALGRILESVKAVDRTAQHTDEAGSEDQRRLPAPGSATAKPTTAGV